MKRNRQRGFSLMEMMVVVGVLTLIMAIVFTAIAHVQGRSTIEAQRVDVTQGAREFLDQFDRDLRNIGYPRAKMYDPALAPTVSIVAIGMTSVSTTELRFEGDIDGSGAVSTVGYRVAAGADGNCPCTLQRSVTVKLAGGGWNGGNYQDALGNVINSKGVGSAWSISGTAPNGVANDVLYTRFKRAPLFQYFDKNNALVPVPADLSGGPNGSTASQVAYVVVTVNVLSAIPDPQTKLRAGTTMQTAVRLANLL